MRSYFVLLRSVHFRRAYRPAFECDRAFCWQFVRLRFDVASELAAAALVGVVVAGVDVGVASYS